MLFDWSEVDGNEISYAISVARDGELTDLVSGYPHDTTGSFHAEADLPVTLSGLTQYFWSVSALDASGAVVEQGPVYSFGAQACGRLGGGGDSNPGYIVGLVASDLSLAALSSVSISVDGEYDVYLRDEVIGTEQFSDSVSPEDTGNYYVEFNATDFGTADVTLMIRAPGVRPQTIETFLTQGSVNFVNIDLSPLQIDYAIKLLLQDD